MTGREVRTVRALRLLLGALPLTVVVVLAGCSSSTTTPLASSTAASSTEATSAGRQPTSTTTSAPDRLTTFPQLSADQVRDLFQFQQAARNALGITVRANEPVFCGVGPLGGSADGRYAYAWVDCRTFDDADGRYTVAASRLTPVRVDRSDMAVSVPRQVGSDYETDVRSLFPPSVAQRILVDPPTVDRTATRLQLLGRLWISRGDTVG